MNFDPPYQSIILHEDRKQCKYFIETEYGKTNYFVHLRDLGDFVFERAKQDTKITIIPQPREAEQ